MIESKEIERLTPGLRRYARALVAGVPEPVEMGDDLVHQTLLRSIAVRRHMSGNAMRLWLYATLTTLNRTSQPAPAERARPGRNAAALQALPHVSRNLSHDLAQRGIGQALEALAVEEREALLLVVLEGFAYGEAAEILGVPRLTLIARLSRARQRLAQRITTVPPGEGLQPRRTAAPHLRVVK